VRNPIKKFVFLPVRRIITRMSRLLIFFVLCLFILSACSPNVGGAAALPATKAVPTQGGVQTMQVPPTLTAQPSPTVITPAPSQTPDAPAGCQEKQGQIEAKQVKSGHLSKALTVWVYLPPCYQKNAARPYPSLIMLHGQDPKGNMWGNLGIAGAADQLIASGQSVPFLIFMPYEEDWESNPYESGFGPAVVEDMLAWSAGEYRVCQERSCRAIGGLSRGASWAFWLGVNHWELFSSIGLHSLPTFGGFDILIPRQLSKIPDSKLPHIYFDIGQGDPFLPDATRFHIMLTQMNIGHDWVVNQGGHTDLYWSTHVLEYLKWYAQFWKSSTP
jgi:enterochelin esterase-like enzyme